MQFLETTEMFGSRAGRWGRALDPLMEPRHRMAEYLQTALEGLWIVAVFLGLVLFVGAGAARLLLPEEWREYELLLMPVVGWCLLVIELFAINLAVGVRVGIYVVIAAAAVVNGFAFWPRMGAGRRCVAAAPGVGAAEAPRRLSSAHCTVLVLGLGLIIVALVPHVVQRSLGLLSLNTDEEIYYPAASYILAYPAIGGPHSLAERFLEGISLYGWGFQYTMAAVSAISGSLPFNVYLPTAYCLLGISVPAWYLLFRETFGLGRRGAALACFFYSILGLPLWFASYGYGPQMASLVAFPVGTAAFVQALAKGGTRRAVVAGLAIAAGLVSYYRVIALQYIFALLPVVVLVMRRKPSLQPLVRTLCIAAVALALGLPSHWHAAQWYFVQGAISQAQAIGENWSEGWGVTEFEPPEVALGTSAYSLVHDAEGAGPLAPVGRLLGSFSAPMAYLILAVATLGFIRAGSREPQLAAIVLGFVAYMAFTRYVLDFKYGYFKLLAVAGPLAYGLVVGALCDLPGSLRGRLAVPVALFLSVAAVYLLYNSYETVWFSAKGWGLSIPNWVAAGLHEMGRVVEPGAKLFIAGRFQYPAPADRVQLRKDHPFAMRREEELRNTWARRVRAIAMTELLHADVYGWFDTQQVWRHYHRLLSDESYDYYLLAPENDPRVEGLDAADRVWSDQGLALYRSRGTVRQTPWTIWRQRGSLAILPLKPLSVWVSSDSIRIDGGLSEAPDAVSSGRLRVGILAFAKAAAVVRAGDVARELFLEPGVTWYTTPTIPLPAGVTVETMGGEYLGVVSLRLLGPGPEEQQLVPESVIRDDIYASSSVLRLEHWLTDPFRGKGPGSL